MRFQFFFILFIFLSIESFSQEIDTNNVLYEYEAIAEEYVDEESLIIELKDETLKSYISQGEDFLSYVDLLKEKDSLVHHFILINGEDNIVPKGDNTNLIDIGKKIDVIFHPNSNKVMYVGEMILNENQAWDFIYESIFDEQGLTRMFIRQYSTFNSVCSQVAFERSEYFFDSQSEIIKKTYEIFDANHNPLNIDDCWMEREDYIKYNSFDELNSKLRIPFEEASEISGIELEETKLETQEEY
ncbi:MAG: hypothetical protein PHN41_01260 [Bacteroidales bacterium]|jgi:hypothetical protein|nr:hypothetical protein [Bacteroidales bacterium]MDD4703379.1 hypothetical protein [Bacteroidales bacterium]MDX9797987.1 hypothetical protein [Bacteroidales bacterium]